MNVKSLSDFRTSFLIIVLGTLLLQQAVAQDVAEQVRLLMKSPDVQVSGTYEWMTQQGIFDRILDSPLMIVKLWEVNQFSPAYKASLRGEAIHVEDPTGIIGDVFLVDRLGNRRVYLGAGNLNHSLVPAFSGKMAAVVTMVPKGSVISAHIDVYVRADNRVLGFFAWSLGPLLKPRIENRLNVNAGNIGDILKDLTEKPQKTAARLKKEDATALMKLLAVTEQN